MLWFSTYAVPPSVTVISVTLAFGGRSQFVGRGSVVIINYVE
jgi:hypothetical protein